ncbi:hypothetical protein AVEN_157408-1, partial [Araneus ventricosus]
KPFGKPDQRLVAEFGASQVALMVSLDLQSIRTWDSVERNLQERKM